MLAELDEQEEEEEVVEEDELEDELDRQDSRNASRPLGSVFSEDTPSTMSEMSVLVGVVTALSGKVVECSDNRWWPFGLMIKCLVDSEIGASIWRRRG